MKFAPWTQHSCLSAWHMYAVRAFSVSQLGAFSKCLRSEGAEAMALVQTCMMLLQLLQLQHAHCSTAIRDINGLYVAIPKLEGHCLLKSSQHVPWVSLRFQPHQPLAMHNQGSLLLQQVPNLTCSLCRYRASGLQPTW